MCDLGPVSGLFASNSGATAIGKDLGDKMPWLDKAPDFSTGELVGQLSGAVGAFGQGQEYSDLAAQREQRAGQILEATKQSISLKRLEQSRAMGQTKAAIGKAGVGMTGSAAKLVERQEILDELTIEAAKNRGILQIGGEMAEAEAATSKARSSKFKGLQLGFELAQNAKGFDLG